MTSGALRPQLGQPPLVEDTGGVSPSCSAQGGLLSPPAHLAATDFTRSPAYVAACEPVADGAPDKTLSGVCPADSRYGVQPLPQRERAGRTNGATTRVRLPLIDRSFRGGGHWCPLGCFRMRTPRSAQSTVTPQPAPDPERCPALENRRGRSRTSAPARVTAEEEQRARCCT